jgi:protein-tyrosine phosphatase
LEFISFAIPDRGVPVHAPQPNSIVPRLVEKLDSGHRVLIHCRQGIGRSSMIGAAVLTAMGEEADPAFAKIARARGRAVPDTEEQKAWVRQFAGQVHASHQTARRVRA